MAISWFMFISFYLSLGTLIYEKNHRFLSIICLMCEAYLLQTHGAYDGNCYVMLMISTPLLFLWALQHETLTVQTDYLGKMSLYIYMIHPLVLNCVRFLFPLSYLWLFIITASITICLSYIITKNQRKGEYHE